MKNYILIVGTFLCNFLFVSVCYPQQQEGDSPSFYKIPATVNKVEVFDNIHDRSIVRVLDGLQLNDSGDMLKEIKIITIRRLNDPVKLQRIGIKEGDRMHIFYSSRVTEFHKDVYSLANLPSELRDVNIPLVINNELITPEKYHFVEKLNVNQITEIEFVKPGEASLIKYGNAVMGAIKISMTVG